MPFAVLVGRDVVLSDAVAPPRTRDRTRGRRVGLAIRGAGAHRGVPVRHGRHHRLQSDRRASCTSARSDSNRKCWARAPRRCRKAAADSGCARRAPTERPSSTPSRAASKAQASAASPFIRSTAPAISSSGSRQRAPARQGYWQLDDARIYSTGNSAGGRGYLSARHQSDARAGAGKLRHAGNSAVLATSQLYRDGGPGGAGRRRATGCNTTNCWPGRSCSPPWFCSPPP